MGTEANITRPSAGAGFTIVELMAVLSVISILAVIALPVYQGYVTRAKTTEGIHAASGAQSQVREYFDSHGFFPTGTQLTGSPGRVMFTGNNVKEIKLNESCEIVVIFNLPGLSDPNPVLRLSPWFDNGTYLWAYHNSDFDGHAGIESKWLPTPIRNLLTPIGSPPPGHAAATSPCGA